MRESWSITDLINDQQLLQLCLNFESTKNYDLDGISGEIICAYASTVLKNGFTEEEFYDQIQTLVDQHRLDQMTKQGILEEDIEGNYTLTDFGYRIAGEIFATKNE